MKRKTRNYVSRNFNVENQVMINNPTIPGMGLVFREPASRSRTTAALLVIRLILIFQMEISTKQIYRPIKQCEPLECSASASKMEILNLRLDPHLLGCRCIGTWFEVCRYLAVGLKVPGCRSTGTWLQVHRYLTVGLQVPGFRSTGTWLQVHRYLV